MHEEEKVQGADSLLRAAETTLSDLPNSYLARKMLFIFKMSISSQLVAMRAC